MSLKREDFVKAVTAALKNGQAHIVIQWPTKVYPIVGIDYAYDKLTTVNYKVNRLEIERYAVSDNLMPTIRFKMSSSEFPTVYLDLPEESYQHYLHHFPEEIAQHLAEAIDTNAPKFFYSAKESLKKKKEIFDSIYSGNINAAIEKQIAAVYGTPPIQMHVAAESHYMNFIKDLYTPALIKNLEAQAIMMAKSHTNNYLNGEWGDLDEIPDPKVNRSTREILIEHFPHIDEYFTSCPVKGCSWYTLYYDGKVKQRVERLMDVVIHLNDNPKHPWTREQIADWIEEITLLNGWDLTLKPKEKEDNVYSDSE